jgi:nucleotide-binding universal stress UspA family protein
MQNKPGSQVIVGVDGSPASIEALIQGQRLAAALGAEVHALACWDFPHIYDGYVAMGIEGLEERWHRSWPRLCRLPS